MVQPARMLLGLSLGGQAFYLPGVAAGLCPPLPCALLLYPASWWSLLGFHLLPLLVRQTVSSYRRFLQLLGRRGIFQRKCVFQRIEPWPGSPSAFQLCVQGQITLLLEIMFSWVKNGCFEDHVGAPSLIQHGKQAEPRLGRRSPVGEVGSSLQGRMAQKSI